MRVRKYIPADLPQIKQRTLEQQERDCRQYPIPELNNRLKVPVVLVAEDERGVQMAAAVERTAELMMLGCSSRATAALRKELRRVIYILHTLGYGVLNVSVPKSSPQRDRIGEALEDSGFRRTDKDFDSYMLDLGEALNAQDQ